MRARLVHLVPVAAIVVALVCASIASASTLDLSRVTRAGGGDSAVSASSSQDAENKARHTGSGDTSQDTRSKDQSTQGASVTNNQSNNSDSGTSQNNSRTSRDRDCSDFSTQEQAQRFFDNHGGSKTNDVDNLDDNGNGVACEQLASGSAPVGGIDTGAGGTAPATAGGSSGPLPFVLGGAGVALLLMLLGTPLLRRQGN